MTDAGRPQRILQLGREGKLLVCTDLHGNLKDFQRVRERFVAERQGGSCQLVFSGDLIHGPNIAEADWPAFMGTFFADRSGDVIEAFIELQRQYPGDVHALLGNHEHSHIGGPHTPKFWPDETAYFEQVVGATRARRYGECFRAFPLIAVAPCGVVLTHAAPNAELPALCEIKALSYAGYEDVVIADASQGSFLTRLLWSRHCPSAVATQFLRDLSNALDLPLRVVVFGHEVVYTGYRHIDAKQLQLSSSFGLRDQDKYVLLLDLSQRYASTEMLRKGEELIRLYD